MIRFLGSFSTVLIFLTAAQNVKMDCHFSIEKACLGLTPPNTYILEKVVDIITKGFAHIINLPMNSWA